MQSENKKIVKNTVINYTGLLINTILGVFIARYVLMALGASDFGLYGVVGGLIAMLNFLSTALTTTTRRYINVELGKTDGNPNKIFNICLIIHVVFAIVVLLVAETIGLYYIYNFLNVASGKLSDAVFVFQVSTIAAVIGIMNVPYQAVIEAYERFDLMVLINVFNTILKLVFVICLLSYDGNILRVYALGMSFLSIILFIFFRIVTYRNWHDLTRLKFYKGKSIYKEIIVFNNYTAMGALAYIGRIQGSTMIVNFFFGTIVNAAFQIAYTIENYCSLIVNNIGKAAWPQITQSFSGGKYDRTIHLTECMSRYTILLTLLVTVPLFVELEFILNLWLKNVPEGALLLCYLTLIDAVVRSACGGTSALIQASGKVKWFQIVDSALSLLTLPVAFILYKLGSPKETIIYLYIISTIIVRVASFILLKKIVDFDIMHYVRNVYSPFLVVVVVSAIYVFIYWRVAFFESVFMHLMGVLISLFVITIVCFCGGLEKQERLLITKAIRNRIKKS